LLFPNQLYNFLLGADFADYTDFPYPFREIRVIRAQKKKVTSDIILPLYHLLNYP